MSYKFVFMFSATITEHHLFLKLMYRAISQQSYKYKLLKFPLDCHLEKELCPFFLTCTKRIQIWKLGDHKLTWRGILNGISSLIKKTVTFDLPPIEEEEEKMDYYESPLTKYLHPKLRSHLIDSRCPEK